MEKENVYSFVLTVNEIDAIGRSLLNVDTKVSNAKFYQDLLEKLRIQFQEQVNVDKERTKEVKLKHELTNESN